MTNKKISVTFEARQELIDRITNYAKQKEVSRAAIIRMALNQFIEEQESKLTPEQKKELEKRFTEIATNPTWSEDKVKPREINIDIKPTFG